MSTETETGQAHLEVDDVTGMPHWVLSGEGWKDSEAMSTGELIQFSPKAFPPGTRIIIMEPDMDTEVSQEFYKEPAKFYPITDEQYAKYC